MRNKTRAMSAALASSTLSRKRYIVLLLPTVAHGISLERLLGHAKCTPGLVVPDARADQHDQAAGLYLSLLDRMIERHSYAGRAGVPKLLHDGVSPVFRKPEALHHAFNRGLSYLSKNEAIDVAQIKTSIHRKPLRNHRPRLLIQLRRIAILYRARRASGFDGLLAGWLKGAARIDSPIVVIGTV